MAIMIFNIVSVIVTKTYYSNVFKNNRNYDLEIPCVWLKVYIIANNWMIILRIFSTIR